VLSFYLPAFLVAFLITVLEMTEVVAVVFALSADQRSVRPGAWGAVAGTSVVAAVALGFGAVIIALPRGYLLWGAAVVLAAFGIFLFRSTLRTFRRAAAARTGAPTAIPPHRRVVLFAGGFSVGVIEAIETVIVLLALAAAGYAFMALIGAVTGGAVLVVAALLVHEQIRKIKVPWLKLGATSVLLSFAVFWAGEAAGVTWPGSDLILIPLVVVVALLVRSAIGVGLRIPVRVDTKS
jgi:uncharacterized membrane protein